MTYQLRNVVVAVVLGLLAAVLVTVYVTNYRKHVQHGAQNVDVLVATTDIPAGTSGATIVAGHMMKALTVPRTALIPGAISSPDQIVRLVSTDEIMSGEQVSTRRFGNSQELGVRAQLKGTMRAIEVGRRQPGPGARGHAARRRPRRPRREYQVGRRFGRSRKHFDRIVLRDLLVLRAPNAPGTKTGNIGNQAVASPSCSPSATRSRRSSTSPSRTRIRAPRPTAGGRSSSGRSPTRPTAQTDIQTFFTVIIDGVSAAAKAHVAKDQHTGAGGLG